MGSGFLFTCPQCEEEYWIGSGVGMGFPQVYQFTLQSIKDGYYGKRMKRIAKSIPYVAVDATKKFYYCRCGFWKTALDMSLYKPNDIDSLLDKEYGIKTVREWGYVPYVTRFEEDYKIVWRYRHYCPVCHKKMMERKRFYKLPLKCRKCGTLLHNEGAYDWD